MKIIFLVISSLLSVLLISGCNYPDYKPLYGFWDLEINENGIKQNFVAYFYADEGKTKCEIHSYYNGLKFGAEPASKIKFNKDALSMIVNQNANIKFEGKLDTINQQIDGHLTYADGSGRDFDLKRIPEKLLYDKYPGLRNLSIKNNKYQRPIEVNDGWEIGSLTNDYFNLKLLDSMISRIHDHEFGNIHSVLIARNGELVFEVYFDGFYINDLHSLQSCTKSIGSLLTGIAIDKGFVNNIDQKVIDFFPDYIQNIDQNWTEVRLKDLLTMTMGISWDKKLHDNIYMHSNDVVRTTLNQKFIESQEKKFEYRNPQADLLSAILIKATGNSVQDFSSEYLFDPLGISYFNWDNYRDNNYPLMSGSLGLRPRDMLKIGQMVLDQGVYGGKQIISSDWIQESTSFKIKTGQTFDYGYLWWLGESNSKDNIKVIFAMGIAGQYIVIIPDLSTVVVTTADNKDRPPEVVLKMIDDYIIKAINPFKKNL